MTESSDAPSQILTASIAKWPRAEVILLTTFRCWLAGYETGDIACWELAWQGLARTVPLADAKRIIAELGQFVRVFRGTLATRFVYLPHCCGRVTADECLALELVASAQRGAVDSAQHCALKLSQNKSHTDLVEAASDLGKALRKADLRLTRPDDHPSTHQVQALHYPRARRSAPTPAPTASHEMSQALFNNEAPARAAPNAARIPATGGVRWMNRTDA